MITSLRNDRIIREDLTTRQRRCSSNIRIVVLQIVDDTISNEFAQAVICILDFCQSSCDGAVNWTYL